MVTKALGFAATVFLEVLVGSAIFNELGGAWKNIRVCIERDRLNHVGGEQMHEGLHLVHLTLHTLRHRVLHSETFQQGLA